MPRLIALIAPIALILPALGHAGTGDFARGTGYGTSGFGPNFGQPILSSNGTGDAICHSPTPDYDEPEEGPYSSAFPIQESRATPLDAFRGQQTNSQVRIEQRVIIRISPRRGRSRVDLSAGLPQPGLNTRFIEHDIDGCVRANRIAGVQTGTGNRLFLFMRNNHIISVNLERSCRAREFYSGFYIEPNEDGRICIERDHLQSRSGAKCQIERMSRLEQVRS